MALEAPAVGEVVLLQYLTNMISPTNLVMHLYTNDPSISATTVIGNITEVGGSIGYAPITLIGTGWTTSTPANLGTAIYSEVTFSFTTAQSVYGYYVTSTSASTLLWMERFSGAPFTLPSGGGTIGITPKCTLN